MKWNKKDNQIKVLLPKKSRRVKVKEKVEMQINERNRRASEWAFFSFYKRNMVHIAHIKCMNVPNETHKYMEH